MEKFVFLISGKAEAGKDTFYNLATQLLIGTPSSHISARYAFGDEVKKVAREGFGWDGEKDEKGRALLQLIGDGARAYKPDIWIERTQKVIMDDLFRFPVDNIFMFITDCRYPNEIEKISEFARNEDVEPISIRIERPNHVSKLTPKQLENPSEIALDDYSFDFVITNDGDMESYREQVKDVLECLKLRK